MAKKDLTGQKFGKLTVIREHPDPYVSQAGKKTRRWVCRCDCGKEVIVLQNVLTANRNTPKSCGCAKSTAQDYRKKSRIGQRFGRLVVIGEERAETPDHNGSRRLFVCQCDCGNIKKYTLSQLLNPTIRSCGCLLSDTAREKIKNGVNGHKPEDITNINLIKTDRKPNRNNKTGTRGVYFCESENRYRAKIGIHGKQIDLGRFETLDAAIKARKEAEKTYHVPILDKYKDEIDRK